MTIAMMNAFGNATTTIIQQFAYAVTAAPQFYVGFRTSLGLICGMVGWVFVVRSFELREQRKMRSGVLERTADDGEAVEKPLEAKADAEVTVKGCRQTGLVVAAWNIQSPRSLNRPCYW